MTISFGRPANYYDQVRKEEAALPPLEPPNLTNHHLATLPGSAQHYTEKFVGAHCRLEVRTDPLGDMVRLTIPKGSNAAMARDELVSEIKKLPNCPEHFKIKLSPEAEASTSSIFTENKTFEFVAAFKDPYLVSASKLPGKEYTDLKDHQLPFLAKNLMRPVDANILAVTFGAFLAAEGFPEDFGSPLWVALGREFKNPLGADNVWGADGKLLALKQWGTGVTIETFTGYKEGFGISGEYISRDGYEIQGMKKSDFEYSLLANAVAQGVPVVMPNGISVAKKKGGEYEVNIPEMLKSLTPGMPDYSAATLEGEKRLCQEMNDFYKAFSENPSRANGLVSEVLDKQLTKSDGFLDLTMYPGIKPDELQKFLADIPGTHRFKLEDFESARKTPEEQLANPFAVVLAMSVLEFTHPEGFHPVIGAESKHDLHIKCAGGHQTHEGGGNIGLRYFHDGFCTHVAVKA